MSQTKIKTLDQAKARIAALEAQLGGKPAETLPEIKLPAKRAAINPTSKAAVTAKLVAPSALAKLQAELNATPDLNSRLHLLKTAETDLRAAMKAEKDQVKQVAISRDLARVQKRAAVEMASDPVAWSKRYHQIEDLA